jgi:hypothetical protein
MAAPVVSHRAPTACAGCYGQYPDRTHVDFKSAIEGGPIDQSNPRSLRVDWVVLCERCIQTAYELLPEQRDIRAEYEAKIAELHERCERAENYASTVEDALSHRPASLPVREREPREPRTQRPRRPNSRDLTSQVQDVMASTVTPKPKPAAKPKAKAAGKPKGSQRYARRDA